MATETLSLGAVTLGPGAPDPLSVVVGSPPQWSDGSDVTYATAESNDHATALVGTLTATGEVTDVQITVRCSGSAATTSFLGILESASDFTFVEPTSFSGGGIHTLTRAVEDLEIAAAVLREGATLQFSINTFAPGETLTIYEVSVVVTYVDATVPVTRLHPRKDGLGPMGSAPRLVGEWPPERLIRY